MQAGTAHGSTPSFIPGTIMQRDAEGRAQVTSPVDPMDIATKHYVDTQLGTGVFYPEPNTLMRRDEHGRTQVAAPASPEDAVNKETLDAALESLTKNHNDLSDSKAAPNQNDTT